MTSKAQQQRNVQLEKGEFLFRTGGLIISSLRHDEDPTLIFERSLDQPSFLQTGIVMSKYGVVQSCIFIE